jgi:hypothetical protein
VVPIAALWVPIVLSAVLVFVVGCIIHPLKSTIDGLIYGLLTGGRFGWLWPA